MTRKTILCALISLSLLPAMGHAQERGHRDDRDAQSHEQTQQRDRPGDQARPNQHPPHFNQGRAQAQRQRQQQLRAQRAAQQHDQQAQRQRQAERGAGPQHAFHRGGRLPGFYHEPQYVVADWRGHNLSAPPRGYHWVRTGDDFVLVAIATGIILQLMLSH